MTVFYPTAQLEGEEMKHFFAYVMVLGMFGLMFIGQAENEEKNQNVKVYIFVAPDKDEETTIRIIESHLKRELRILGDVEIVDFDDDWKFRIMIRTLSHKTAGRKTGDLSLTCSFHVKVPKRLFKHYDFPPDYEPVYVNSFPLLANWGKERIPSWCVAVANDFEEQYLKPHLKMVK